MNGLITKVIAVSLVVIMQLTNATMVFAQSSPDTRSPLIELEAVAESEADSAQVFTAQVVDNRVLKDVFLYYRRAGQQPFSPVTMSQIGDSGYFTAALATDPTDLRAIEYYIQARDESGNRTVEGYAFDPYTRMLITNDTLITNSTPANKPIVATANKSLGSKLRWWHIATGVVIVGALVSASGKSRNSSDENTARLTVNLTGL